MRTQVVSTKRSAAAVSAVTMLLAIWLPGIASAALADDGDNVLQRLMQKSTRCESAEARKFLWEVTEKIERSVIIQSQWEAAGARVCASTGSWALPSQRSGLHVRPPVEMAKVALAYWRLYRDIFLALHLPGAAYGKESPWQLLTKLTKLFRVGVGEDLAVKFAIATLNDDDLLTNSGILELHRVLKAYHRERRIRTHLCQSINVPTDDASTLHRVIKAYERFVLARRLGSPACATPDAELDTQLASATTDLKIDEGPHPYEYTVIDMEETDEEEYTNEHITVFLEKMKLHSDDIIKDDSSDDDVIVEYPHGDSPDDGSTDSAQSAWDVGPPTVTATQADIEKLESLLRSTGQSGPTKTKQASPPKDRYDEGVQH